MSPNLLVDCGVGCSLFAVGQSQVRHKIMAMAILVAGAETRTQRLQLIMSLLNAEPGHWAVRRGKLVETCAGHGEGFDRCCGLPDTFGECGCIAASAQGGVEQSDMSRAWILHPDVVAINISGDRRQQLASRIDANYYSPVPPVVSHR